MLNENGESLLIVLLDLLFEFGRVDLCFLDEFFDDFGLALMRKFVFK